MGKLVIQCEKPDDRDGVAEVVRLAFADEPQVVEMISAVRASSRYRAGLAFVARLEDQVVGFVMLSGTDLVDEDGRRREVLILTPLAVLPERQRRGIGSRLVAASIAEADRRREPLVVVEGSPTYYGRLGFEFAPHHGVDLHLPDWAPREAAQVYLLSNYGPEFRGHVDYPPAIAALSVGG